jgi:hypothetical protein
LYINKIVQEASNNDLEVNKRKEFYY